MTRATTRLRQLLRGPKLLQVPGAIDAIGARLVAEAGFDADYMTGAGTTASRLGWPDVGLLTMTEMADNAQRIAEASGLPLIADADTGYGGPLNVQRTIRCYERAGVAGLHIEDQSWPKRCGHLDGKTLIPQAEMAAHIRAACDARTDPDLLIIARTDAIAVEGFERAIERAQCYQEAGADAIFVEAPRNREQLERIPKSVRVPALYNMAASGKTPFLGADEIQSLGFALAIYPNYMLLAAIPAMRGVLKELKETGTVAGMVDRIASFRELFDLMGMQQVRELESRYGVDEASQARY